MPRIYPFAGKPALSGAKNGIIHTEPDGTSELNVQPNGGLPRLSS